MRIRIAIFLLDQPLLRQFSLGHVNLPITFVFQMSVALRSVSLWRKMKVSFVYSLTRATTDL